MERYLIRTLCDQVEPLGYEVWPEQRIRTHADPAHFRIPDLCVTFGEPPEDIFTTPPFLCIEILSPEDSALELRLKIDEYLTFGVAFVWVIDPESLTGEIYTGEAVHRARDGVFTAGPIRIALI